MADNYLLTLAWRLLSLHNKQWLDLERAKLKAYIVMSFSTLENGLMIDLGEFIVMSLFNFTCVTTKANKNVKTNQVIQGFT